MVAEFFFEEDAHKLVKFQNKKNYNIKVEKLVKFVKKNVAI